MANTSESDSQMPDPDFEHDSLDDLEDVAIETADEIGWVFEIGFSAEQAQQLFSALRDTEEDAITFVRRAALEAASAAVEHRVSLRQPATAD